MTKIIFLYTINHFKKMESIESGFCYDSNNIIFAKNIELRQYLNNENIPFNVPEDFIYDNEIINMREFSVDIGYNWHKDLFKFQEISLGKLGAWNNIYYFSGIVRNLKTIINIIEKINPIEFISFEDKEYTIYEFNRVLEYVSKNKKINLTLLPLDRINKTRSGLKETLKSLLYTINSLPSYTPLKSLFKPLIITLHRIKTKNNKRQILMEGYYKNPRLF